MHASPVGPTQTRAAASRSRLARWLDEPWCLAVWCVLAAFGGYACMYGFRKPFTAGTYLDTEFGDKLKTWLVTAQVLGYMTSKFVGIKIIAEMTPGRRASTMLGLIVIAELALLLFAVTPAPYNAAFLFLNGLPLGLVFGLVLGFLEGRRMTELFVAGLCASFILADGATKTVGALLLRSGVPERWMPFAAGLVFLGPFVTFVWMLRQIPPPNQRDVAERSARAPMTRTERWALLRRQGRGLFLIVAAYLLITILRSVRADFAPEIWASLGLGKMPSLFTLSELWVAIGSLVASGLMVLVHDNRRALLLSLSISSGALALALVAMAAQRAGALPPFAFMVILGLGLYLPYVAVQTSIFERLVALTRERANIGFLMYLADAAGYLGYAATMLVKSAFPEKQGFLSFFLHMSNWILGLSLLSLLGALAFYARRHSTATPAPVEVPAPETDPAPAR